VKRIDCIVFQKVLTLITPQKRKNIKTEEKAKTWIPDKKFRE